MQIRKGITFVIAALVVVALSTCSSEPPTEDTDAGTTAPEVDGGVADSGVDAGVEDAGATDAGVDGGQGDAGVTDAGVDGGQPDAGGSDAGLDGGSDAGAPDAGPGVENTDALCSDNQDNDADNLEDCADPDCKLNSAVTLCTEAGLCGDGFDNDGDGTTDCRDRTCNGSNGQPPDVTSCTAIQNVQDGTVPTGTLVRLHDVFVTALKGAPGQNVSLYVQEPQGDTVSGHSYPQFAGVRVFLSAAQSTGMTLPAVGSCVSITATTTEFQSETELISPTITLEPDPSACGTFPSPFAIPSSAPATSFADLATDTNLTTSGNQPGPKTEEYEGVLVQMNNVQVVVGLNSNNEFQVTPTSSTTGPRLSVDDFFYLVPTPTVGTTYSSVRGIYTQFTDFKLLPRSSADVVP